MKVNEKWGCGMKLNSQIAQALHKRFNKGLKTKDAIGISLALHLLAGMAMTWFFVGTIVVTTPHAPDDDQMVATVFDRGHCAFEDRDRAFDQRRPAGPIEDRYVFESIFRLIGETAGQQLLAGAQNIDREVMAWREKLGTLGLAIDAPQNERRIEA